MSIILVPLRKYLVYQATSYAVKAMDAGLAHSALASLPILSKIFLYGIVASVSILAGPLLTVSKTDYSVGGGMLNSVLTVFVSGC